MRVSQARRSVARTSIVLALVGGCAIPDDAESTASESGSAIARARVPAGSTLRATRDVNLRRGPSTGTPVVVVVPSGAVVVVADGAPTNGYYNVSYEGATGWVYGDYLAPTETHPVEGRIRDAYERLGGEARFGLPMEAARPGPGGTVQHFQKGCIGPDGSGELAAFTVCEEPPDLGPVLARIASTVAARSNRTRAAMGAVWLPTKQRWLHNGDETHVSASSPKWSWAMAALAKQEITRVEPDALPTFERSDNIAAGNLIDLAGGIDAVNDFTINKLGIPQEQFNLCYWNHGRPRRATTCSEVMRGNNYFSPRGTLTFLEKTWERAVIGREKGDKLFEWALRSPRSGYGGWVGTQLPASAQPALYHKSGWLPPGCCSNDADLNNMNDVAVVITPRGPYAISLLFDRGTDYWGAQTKSLEWASCVVYHAFAKDAADPFAAGCVSP